MPYELISLDGSDLLAYSLDDELGKDLGIYDVAAWGPRVVFSTANTDRMRNLYLVDLAGHSLTVLASAPPREERVWEPDISGDWVVWTEYHYENPGVAGRGPSQWRLRAANVANGASHVIATGTHTRIVGLGGGAAPAIARVDGNLVAYKIEAPRPGHPDAWSIVIRSLADDRVVRTIETDRDVYKFDLATGNVVYSEGSTDKVLDFKHDTRLMISTAEHPEPFEIGRNAYEVTAGGDRFAWVWDEASGQLGSPMPIAPIVMTATFSDPTVVQASVLTEGPPPPEGWGPPLLGGLFPGASGDWVAWQDRQTDGAWDGELRRVAVFDARTGRAYQLEPSPNPVEVELQGGWIVWNVDTNAERTGVTHAIVGVPLDAVLGRVPK